MDYKEFAKYIKVKQPDGSVKPVDWRDSEKEMFDFIQKAHEQNKPPFVRRYSRGPSKFMRNPDIK